MIIKPNQHGFKLTSKERKMKKSLLTIALATLVFVGFSGIANAATVSVDTSQEESMIAKKLNNELYKLLFVIHSRGNWSKL